MLYIIIISLYPVINGIRVCTMIHSNQNNINHPSVIVFIHPHPALASIKHVSNLTFTTGNPLRLDNVEKAAFFCFVF